MFPKAGRTIPTFRSSRSTSYAGAIAEVLRSELGDSHRALKTLMQWTGANERTAKNWLSGANGPSGEHLLRLMRSSNRVFECVLELSDRQPILSRHKLEELLSVLSNTTQVLAEAMSIDTAYRNIETKRSLSRDLFESFEAHSQSISLGMVLCPIGQANCPTIKLFQCFQHGTILLAE